MTAKNVFSLLLASFFFSAHVDAAPAREPVVLILLHSSEGPENPALRALVVRAISVELENRNVTAVSSEQSADGAPAVYSLALDKKADFAISGTYTVSGPDVELSLAWYDVGERKSFPEARDGGPLNLAFDTRVTRLVDGLLDEHRERLASLPPLPQVATEPREPTAPVRAPEASAGSPVPRPAALSFSLGSAPFIPVFKASAYIQTVGLSFSAEGEYRFPIGGGLLGITILSGIQLFHAEKASTADAFAIPVAAGVIYRTLTGSLVDFSLRAGAGPSIFVLKPAGGESSIGVVPFIFSGLGVTINLSKHVAASAAVDYMAILVPDAIMGFVPSLALDMRF